MSFIDDELIRQCIVPIIVSEQPSGLGFFVAPNLLLTCAHLVPDFEDNPSQNASDLKIHLGGLRLPAQITKKADEGDLALLSVELTDHLYLSLNEDIASFEVLHVYEHTALMVKGFAGNAEEIVFEAGGDDIIAGMSGAPLFNPRTGGVCGLIRGRDSKTKAVIGIHINNALKSFPELISIHDNIRNIPSNIIKVFIVYDENDEALFNALVQSLRDTNLSNLALYWESDEEVWPSCPPTTFETAKIILLLVSSNPDALDDYYKYYVQRTLERYKLEEIRAFQVLPPNVSLVVNWPQESITLGEFAKGIQEVIEALNSIHP